MAEIESPKTFISYSWTSPEHVEWVIELAEELVENGIDVVLDQWDLQEGQDMYAFMEQMVTDKDMDKVIVVSDKEYARKADEREGGVGTETQIVSQDLYDEVDPDDPQKKFVAVVTEKDDDGQAYLPTYLRNRLYIDMSTPESRMDNFERLLRWLYDQPLHERPERGEPPEYLFQDDGPDLGTRSRAKRAKKLLRNGESAALGALREYFETFAESLERLRIEPEGDRPSPEEVIESIESFLPFRNEVVDVFVTLATYWPGDEGAEVLHVFFERLLPYTYGEKPHWSADTSGDNFKFFVYELFVYAIAILLRSQRFAAADHLLSRGYYLPKGEHRMDPGIKPYTQFRPYLRSLEEDMDHNRVSKTADILFERAARNDITFDDIMQADLILYLRGQVDKRYRGVRQYGVNWHPYSLAYAGRRRHPFELFARASTRDSFHDLRVILRRSSMDEFVSLIETLQREDALPKFNNWPLEIRRLVALESGRN
jgi:hypothetical protein